MREHYELFKSPISRASRLGRYTPMMRKDTFMHRMSYNARPFQDQTRDHSALLAALLHRLNNMNPNDARFSYYQNQIQQVQNKLDDLHQKHGEMMQGRNNLMSYVTSNAGNLVPADAVNAMLTGNYANFRPPIVSPQSQPQPPPQIVSDAQTPPPGPIGSLENAPEIQPTPTEEAPPPAEVIPPAEPPAEPPAPPSRPNTGNRFLRNLREAREARHGAPSPAPEAPAPEIEEPEYQYVYALRSANQMPTPPTAEEDDRNLYEILKAKKNLSASERPIFENLKSIYGEQEEEPQSEEEEIPEEESSEEGSSSSEEERPPSPPHESERIRIPNFKNIEDWVKSTKAITGKYPEGYLTVHQYKRQHGNMQGYRPFILNTLRDQYEDSTNITEVARPPATPKPSTSRPTSATSSANLTPSRPSSANLTPSRPASRESTPVRLTQEQKGKGPKTRPLSSAIRESTSGYPEVGVPRTQIQNLIFQHPELEEWEPSTSSARTRAQPIAPVAHLTPVKKQLKRTLPPLKILGRPSSAKE